MPLEEYQYYIKLYNQKQDEEESRARQAAAQSNLEARMPDGKSIGQVLPQVSK
jgi:hypothetical protein